MTPLSRGRRGAALCAVVATTIVALLLLAFAAPSTAQPSYPQFEYFDVTSVAGKPKTAAWSPRTELQVFRTETNIQYYKQSGLNGVQIMTAPPGSFLLMGGSADVWISTDGFDWYILSGPATASLGYIPNWLANTFPFSYGQCYAKDRNDFLYVMRDNYVWISPNAGKNWTVNNAAGTGSNRAWFSCMVDRQGVLYNVAGSSTYISTNQGQSWTYKSDSPWQFKGRVGQSGGTYFSQALNADLIYIMGGGRPAMNDVWVTRDGATTWVQLSANAPWPARYDSRFAATADGVLIVAGGRPDDSNSFNDVWTSVDGGYNWWLMRNHASFSPRGLPAITVDRDGYLWIFGGQEFIYVGNIPQWTSTNKISRSTHSFNSQQLKVWGPKVARGMYSGTCLGLVCWPLEQCRCSDTTAPADFNFVAQTLNAPFQPRFNGHIRELAHTMEYYGRDANGAIALKTAPVGSFVFYGGMNASWMGVADGWLASPSLATWEPMFGPAAAAINISPSTYSIPTMSPGQAHCSKSLPSGSRFYSIGGDGQGNVWRSTNNRQWTSVNSGFSGRSYGLCGVTDSLRVWHFKWDQLRYSDNDGSTWTDAPRQNLPIARDAGFGGSYYSTSLSAEVIYLSGGINNGYNYNDVWYTTDWGTTWYMTTSAAAWAARADAAAVVDSTGVMVIMAGQAGGFRDWFNDAWFTADGGYTWHELTSADAISTRAFPSVTITSIGRIVSVAGNRENGGYSNDAYISEAAYLLPNILAWGPLVARTFKAETGCRGLNCLSGGTCRCGRRAANMFDIKKVTNINAAPFTPRFNIGLFRTTVAHSWPALRQTNGVYSPVTLNDEANSWIVYGGGVGVADVWVSTNKGASWECIAGVPGNPAIPNGFWDSFKDREGQGMCKDPYNDKLYIMGGKDPSSGAATAWQREVWSATDGQDWLQIQAGTADGPGVWPGRAYLMCSVDTKGRLYATGGNDDGYGLVDDDTYMSQDGGATWTLVNTKVTYPPRAAFFGGSHYGRLQGKSLIYAIGGISFRNFNDVWVTSDGAKTWALITATAPWSARADASVAFSDSGVIVLYGGQLRSFDRFLSDTWMSLDGGFNWWQVAPFTTILPRSYAGALIDESGYLWLVGGNMMWTNVNDVYRSTLQFTDSEIARWGPALIPDLVPQALPKNAAGVNTFGLACWPGQACKYDVIAPNYSCYGIPDAEDGSGTQCPDQAASSSSSLSGGAIAGIVIGVIVGVVVIAALLLALVRGRSDKGTNFGGSGGSKFTPQHDVEMSRNDNAEEPAETA